ncbi:MULTISPECIES: RHS repeat domain-containing protein [Bacteroides]|uniref:RHS repeat domain-containing protein n=1 Tax=Bacteroides TaxID=816 RepID=UPI0023F3951B|nr:RHS repeat-associated core domain-containing protein [Bacteroides graminisolvens]MDD3211172.1 RHS repeat-associated core domain-containing protein [Bacteroides graminisolvens]
MFFKAFTNKRLPGCDWTYYVYDTGDRLIFAQDGEQRARGEWSFTVPDVFGRVSVSGTCKNTLNALSATSPLNGIVVKATRDNVTGTYKGYALSGITLVNPTVLNVSYYDDYAFMGTNGIPASTDANFKYDAETGYDTRYTASTKTFLTGTLTAKLEGSSTPSYLCSVMYYDNRGRVIQTKSQNHLSGGIEKEYVAYNFTGQPTGRKHVHTATGKATQTELYTYAYDHAGRLTTVKHKLNTGTEVTLAENTYDELGRLKTNKKNGQSALTSSYAYNIRSWMKSVASPLFSQTFYYNDTYAGNTPRYNGNISAMSWSVSGENKTRGYNFTYDNLSRLTGAGYLENGNANDRFNTSYAYDKHGNMTLLSRRGNTGTTTYGLIDNLSMTYAGNQLVKTEDTGSSVTLSQSMDFKNNANLATEYLYDKNGNLIKDYNKSITEISYNVLNLPQTLKISSATNTYTYAADGRKLKTVLGGSKTTDYCGNVIYENGLLKRILVDGGYIENGTYYFYLTDHLGNNRVIASSSGSIIQSNHYYPFGMSFTEGSATSQQPYKYNGKELDTERGLNLYDYSARLMDPTLGRFNTVDPMAEKYYSISPYTYCANNPVNRIDPDGRADFEVNGKIIGNDGVDDGRRLVLKTTQKRFESETDNVPGAGLSRKEMKATVKFIKRNSGNTEAFQNNGMAYNNSVEIEGSVANRQAMVNEVSRDNGRGGTVDANNREYGGSIQSGAVAVAEPGAVADPSVAKNASIMLPDVTTTFHSHPSGTKSEIVANGTKNSWFNQFPSSVDVENAGTGTHYVFGRGDGKVYVYTSGGVQAVIPMKRFVNPKR